MKVLSETKQVRIRLRSNGTNRWKLVVILRDNKDRLHEAHIARRVLEAIHPCHFITELAKAYHPADKWIISQLKHPNNTVNFSFQKISISITFLRRIKQQLYS
jgi:hypothetical protein